MSPVARLETEAGERFFLKWADASAPPGLLAAEARGLRELSDAGSLRVPTVIAASSADSASWLLLEWLEPGRATAAAWRRLGAGLAAQHRTRGPRPGADADNFIGPLPQSNAAAGSWAGFWWTRRLEPQLERAVREGRLDDEVRGRFESLRDRLEGALEPGDSEGPSLLHGDLWSGNVHMMPGDEPAVIDPSVYHGHREVDLAMAELFGGFGDGFRAAYEEAWPLEPGYAPRRRAIYQLYYLLVHVNLFGSGYVGGTLWALDEAGV